jgi:hypothetical protein
MSIINKEDSEIFVISLDKNKIESAEIIRMPADIKYYFP